MPAHVNPAQGDALYGAGMFIAVVYPILSPTTHVQPDAQHPILASCFLHAHAVNGFSRRHWKT
jgi:hypothetical protein